MACAGRRLWACRPCPRCQCCPLEPYLPLPVSPGFGESMSSVRLIRWRRKKGQEQVLTARGGLGGIPDWAAPPGQGRFSLHAALTGGSPGFREPPQPPRHSWGFRPWQQLRGVKLEPHRVVPGPFPAVLEAQDLFQAQFRVQRPKCRLGV